MRPYSRYRNVGDDEPAGARSVPSDDPLRRYSRTNGAQVETPAPTMRYGELGTTMSVTPVARSSRWTWWTWPSIGSRNETKMKNWPSQWANAQALTWPGSGGMAQVSMFRPVVLSTSATVAWETPGK